ncbi:hypothetical protein L4174_023770 (plasmid) [Photobacterium sp. CCB-ST2H9]|uniref:hypothetical protein n=1 Tax=Photobacterium sp. CCB-ST2H9 TaxID=2912855 RepID=UPI0020041F96|nr:hypothetical protein [Photobacterium sp. CCB-ST2H9]UTM60487.1 hypothetical protein L4174_023770 [Photobacterium sp. CCB-ST2H9]
MTINKTTLTISDQDNLPLIADLAFAEQFTSASLNRKFKGIARPGIYRGFNYTIGKGLKLIIGDDGGKNTAYIERGKYTLTVQGQHPIEVVVPAGKKSAVVLEGYYEYGVKTKQVDRSATAESVTLKVIDSVARQNHHVVICEVNVPAGAKQLTDAMISEENRIAGGIDLDSHIDVTKDPHKQYFKKSGGPIYGPVEVKGSVTAEATKVHRNNTFGMYTGGTDKYVEVVPVDKTGKTLWDFGLRWMGPDIGWTIGGWNKLYNDNYHPEADMLGKPQSYTGTGFVKESFTFHNHYEQVVIPLVPFSPSENSDISEVIGKLVFRRGGPSSSTRIEVMEVTAYQSYMYKAFGFIRSHFTAGWAWRLVTFNINGKTWLGIKSTETPNVQDAGIDFIGTRCVGNVAIKDGYLASDQLRPIAYQHIYDPVAANNKVLNQEILDTLTPFESNPLEYANGSKYYTEFHKPTPAEIGAVATQGTSVIRDGSLHLGDWNNQDAHYYRVYRKSGSANVGVLDDGSAARLAYIPRNGLETAIEVGKPYQIDYRIGGNVSGRVPLCMLDAITWLRHHGFEPDADGAFDLNHLTEENTYTLAGKFINTDLGPGAQILTATLEVTTRIHAAGAKVTQRINHLGKSCIRYMTAAPAVKWTDWAVIYDGNNKPTPEDVGAVSRNGDEMTGSLENHQQNVYMGVSLPTVGENNRNLLRKFRGGKSNTIFHEVVQNSTWEIWTGNEPSRRELRLIAAEQAQLWLSDSRVYAENYKPKPQDIGAYPETGGILKGDLQIEKGDNQKQRISMTEVKGEHGFYIEYQGDKVSNTSCLGTRHNKVDVPFMQIERGSKDVKFLGSTDTDGLVKEQGKRVYSPNNIPKASELGVGDAFLNRYKFVGGLDDYLQSVILLVPDAKTYAARNNGKTLDACSVFGQLVFQRTGGTQRLNTLNINAQSGHTNTIASLHQYGDSVSLCKLVRCVYEGVPWIALMTAENPQSSTLRFIGSTEAIKYPPAGENIAHDVFQKNSLRVVMYKTVGGPNNGAVLNKEINDSIEPYEDEFKLRNGKGEAFYSPSNKPTPEDLNALSTENGGTVKKPVSVLGSVSAYSLVARGTGNSKGLMLLGTDSYTELAPIDSNGVTQWSNSIRWYGSTDWRVGSNNRIFHEGYLPKPSVIGAYSIGEVNSKFKFETSRGFQGATVTQSPDKIWYRIATAKGGNPASAIFTIGGSRAANHSSVTFIASCAYGQNPNLTLISKSHYADIGIHRIRLEYGSTYEDFVVMVEADVDSLDWTVTNAQSFFQDFKINDSIDRNAVMLTLEDKDKSIDTVGGHVYSNGYKVYSAGNKPKASDVNAYSKEESNSKFLGIKTTAENSKKLGGKTLNEVVESITRETITRALLDKMFPVGHILYTTNKNNPSTYEYPGVWELEEDDLVLISTTDEKKLGLMEGENHPAVPVPKHGHSASANDHYHLYQKTDYLTASEVVNAGLAQRAVPDNGWSGWVETGRSSPRTIGIRIHNSSYKTSSATGSISINPSGTDKVTLDVRGKRRNAYIWVRTK